MTNDNLKNTYEQNDENIKIACNEIERVRNVSKAKAGKNGDIFPLYFDHILYLEYDHSNVNEFYEKKREQASDGKFDDSFKYEDHLNCSKLFLPNGTGTGACQQKAVGLAMLCYNDPNIECYQMIVEIENKKPTEKEIPKYKHSVDLVIKRDNKGKIISKGIYDATNDIKANDFDEYTKIFDRGRNKYNFKFLGAAYYPKGKDLDKIFTLMQSFGKGIKFDIDGFLKSDDEYANVCDYFKNKERLNKWISFFDQKQKGQDTSVSEQANEPEL